MALTKVSQALGSTPSIDDNGTTTAVTIDSSGNVGIGVTPNSWSSGKIVLQASNASFVGQTDRFEIWSNGYYDGANSKYIGNNYATLLQSVNGEFIFNNAPSGIAGNNITFSERMRINSSGNVGIGTSSPSSKMHIKQSADNFYSGYRVERSSATTQWGTFSNHGGATWISSVDTGNVGNDILVFGRSTDGTTFTESMRIDSSGNVGINKTSPSVKLDLIGAASNSATQIQVGTNGYPAINFLNSVGTQQGYIVVNASSVSYTSISDQRMKENILDAADAGAKIDAIQVRQFDWKADGSHQDYGMVAQELVEVAPEAVNQPQDTEQMMGVDYSKLVPMLVKEIQSLRQRVADLEGA